MVGVLFIKIQNKFGKVIYFRFIESKITLKSLYGGVNFINSNLNINEMEVKIPW